MTTRYAPMFERLALRRQGAFIPFVTLGDPSPDHTLGVLRALVDAGADALELGIPFSDPVADGPTIQAADVRALDAGTTPDRCWDLLTQLRAYAPSIPVGLLVYANLVFHRGVDDFYQRAAAAGVDSILVADVPAFEAAPFATSAAKHDIDHVMIAPPNASPERLEQIARTGRGYTYVVTRAGVTGQRDALDLSCQALIARLRQLDAPPPVLGFGISTPDHVRQALDTGASGAISGSAVVRRIADHLHDPQARHDALTAFVREMKAATLTAT